MNAHLSRLVDHLRWADERMLDSVARVDPLPADVLERVAHILAAEHVWLSRLASRAPSHAVWPTLTLDECRALALENAAELRHLVDTLDDARLAEVVSYTNSAGHAFASRVDDIVLHVAIHGEHHRGQIALLLRRSGHEPVLTDYIGWVRGAPRV